MKSLMLLGVLVLVACGSDITVPCETGQKVCDGADALKACVDGVWQAPTPCSAVCQARQMVVGGACAPDGKGSADCNCAPVCQLGATKCEGASLKTCNGTAWEVASCDTICTTGGYVKATGCAFDSVKGADACSCEALGAWGESCSTTKACPSPFVCVTYGGGSFCTRTCTTAGTKCGGAPAASYGGCLIKMSDGTMACAFLCKTSTGSYTCPGSLSCSSSESPAGSGQYPCLP